MDLLRGGAVSTPTFQSWTHLIAGLGLKYEWIMSSIALPLIAIAAYLFCILSLQRCFRTRKPLPVSWLFILHNSVLTMFSLVSFVGSLCEACKVVARHGLWQFWYNDQTHLEASPLYDWIFLFYLSKFYELLDTIFLVVMKKPVMIVGPWHHCTVILLLWCSFVCNTRSANAIVCIINSFVHIFTYSYFLLNALKIRVPWKRYVTLLQMGQFAVIFLYGLPYPYYYAWRHGDHTHPGGFFFNVSIGLSYWQLWSKLYRSRYTDTDTDTDTDRQVKPKQL